MEHIKQLTFGCHWHGEVKDRDITEDFLSLDYVQCKSFEDTDISVAVRDVDTVSFESGCHFRTFPENLFSKFFSLRILKANRTGIISFQAHNLPTDHSKLETLDLSSNSVQNFDSALLEAIPTLKHLNLHRNGMTTLSPFPAVSQLESLILSNNLVVDIPEDTFKGLSQLKELRLDENKLSSAAVHFGYSNKLEILDLTFNTIHELRTGDFRHLTALKVLDVHYSQVAKIEFGTFSPLISLGTLNLSFNKLAKIDFRMFLPSMPSLTTLRLELNQLTELNDHFEAIFPQLNELTIEANQFNCTYLSHFLLTLRSRSHAIVYDHSHGDGTNIRGIRCKLDEEQPSAPHPAEGGIQKGDGHGFGSGYNVSIFILVLWISLANLVICGGVVLVVRKTGAFKGIDG